MHICTLPWTFFFYSQNTLRVFLKQDFFFVLRIQCVFCEAESEILNIFYITYVIRSVYNSNNKLHFVYNINQQNVYNSNNKLHFLYNINQQNFYNSNNKLHFLYNINQQNVYNSNNKLHFLYNINQQNVYNSNNKLHFLYNINKMFITVTISYIFYTT